MSIGPPSGGLTDGDANRAVNSPHRISLVVPLYDSAAFITAALASVAGQSRPVDEVIVVDDASTDGGGELAARWEQLLPLRVIRHERNLGLGATRRTGIAATSGGLVALLDADDVWLPDHVETMLATWHRHGGLVTADTLWWAPGRELSRVTGRRRKRIPPLEAQRLGILDHNFVHPITLFARADYERAGGFADLRQMEDWDLWMRMIRLGVPVHMAPTPTALYRIHGRSLSAGRGNLETNVKELPKYLDQLDPVERRVLRRTIRRRQARQDLLAGEARAAEGRLGHALWLWARAAVRDRRLDGGLTGGRSSVSVQALANMLTAGCVGRMRRARAGTAGAGLRRR